ncbi:MAG: signal peptidase I [Firmicutes bacterium]|nr:signal peptidase I [Bacillota bacterium]
MKVIKEIFSYIIVIAVALLIRTFIITPVKVDGASMYPTLEHNQILILKKYDTTYERFNIVVINYNGEKLVKRIIGLPGEIIEYKNNKLYVDGKKINEPLELETDDFSLNQIGYTKIPKEYYLVLGDNRGNSTDSRIIGLIKKDDILGTTNLRIWPFKKIGIIKNA